MSRDDKTFIWIWNIWMAVGIFCAAWRLNIDRDRIDDLQQPKVTLIRLNWYVSPKSLYSLKGGQLPLPQEFVLPPKGSKARIDIDREMGITDADWDAVGKERKE